MAWSDAARAAAAEARRLRKSGGPGMKPMPLGGFRKIKPLSAKRLARNKVLMKQIEKANTNSILNGGWRSGRVPDSMHSVAGRLVPRK